MRKFKIIIISAASLFGTFLAACGSDSGTDSDNDADADMGSTRVETIYDLGECKGANEGVTKYVTSEFRYYTCSDGRWEASGSEIDTVETEEDLQVCSDGVEGAVVWLLDRNSALVCVDGSWESYAEQKSKSSSSVGGKGSNPSSGDSARKENSSSSNSKGESSSSVDNSGYSSDSKVDEISSSSEKESSSSVLSSSSDASIYDPDENTLTDLRDGQVYRTTTIGIPSKSYSEVWMAENLNYETANSWCGGGSGTTEGDCSVYGRLYTWVAATVEGTAASTESPCGDYGVCVRGVCPRGWHLPSQSEWNELVTAVGSSVAGKMLKSETRWNSYSGIEYPDIYLFSALPAGERFDSGHYAYEGKEAYFWSSTEYNNKSVYRMWISVDTDGAILDNGTKNYGHSVRCLKNKYFDEFVK